MTRQEAIDAIVRWHASEMAEMPSKFHEELIEERGEVFDVLGIEKIKRPELWEELQRYCK